MSHFVHVDVESGDRVCWVVFERGRALVAAGARARSVERGDGAATSVRRACNIWRQPISGGALKQITHFTSDLVRSLNHSQTVNSSL